MITVVGIGVDLVDVREIRRMIEISGDSFLLAAWTERELRHSSGRPEQLAALWAAKEAAMKALGIGLGDISPIDVEVEMVTTHQPSLALHGDAATTSARLGIDLWRVALSADRHWALATAIAFADPN